MLNRREYETQLDMLAKAGGFIFKRQEIEAMEDMELMMAINNWLIFFDCSPISFDEMNRIIKTDAPK